MNTRTLTTTLFALSPDALVVTVGSASTYGVLNDDEQVGTDEMGQPVTMRDRTVFVAAGTLTGVQDGATLTIRPKGAATSATVSYTVRGTPRPRENGDLWAIAVARLG